MITTSYAVTRNFTIPTSVGVQGDYYHILAIIPLAAIGGLGLGYLLWARRRSNSSPSGAALSLITSQPTPSIDEYAENRVLCSSGGNSIRAGTVKFCKKCGDQLELEDKFCGRCGAEQRKMVTTEVTQTSAPKTKFCRYCGSKIPRISNYCEECGRDIQPV